MLQHGTYSLEKHCSLGLHLDFQEIDFRLKWCCERSGQNHSNHLSFPGQNDKPAHLRGRKIRLLTVIRILCRQKVLK